MKNVLASILVVSAAVGAFALGLTDVPNEGAYPAAKPVINANSRLIETAMSNVENSATADIANLASVSNLLITTRASLLSVSNAVNLVVTNMPSVSFLNIDGTTNTLVFTNGTIRIQ
jgi:hypothetical protein